MPALVLQTRLHCFFTNAQEDDVHVFHIGIDHVGKLFFTIRQTIELYTICQNDQPLFTFFLFQVIVGFFDRAGRRTCGFRRFDVTDHLGILRITDLQRTVLRIGFLPGFDLMHRIDPKLIVLVHHGREDFYRVQGLTPGFELFKVLLILDARIIEVHRTRVIINDGDRSLRGFFFRGRYWWSHHRKGRNQDANSQNQAPQSFHGSLSSQKFMQFS